MNISRKEFLTRGLAAFARDLLTVAKGEKSSPASYEAVANGPLLVDNRSCLASRGGCFSCLDACPLAAISITAGVGIVVDASLCDGCGACILICPLDPKPIRLAAATTD